MVLDNISSKMKPTLIKEDNLEKETNDKKKSSI